MPSFSGFDIFEKTICVLAISRAFKKLDLPEALNPYIVIAGKRLRQLLGLCILILLPSSSSDSISEKFNLFFMERQFSILKSINICSTSLAYILLLYYIESILGIYKQKKQRLLINLYFFCEKYLIRNVILLSKYIIQ